VFFLNVQNYFSFCVSCGLIFICKSCLGLKIGPSTFFFFVNLIFLNFFVFFENEQYQR
jgi:hypothetical protein